MASEQAAPVTFRPKSVEARALLEAVAEHQNMSLSKFVAYVTDDFARRYIEKKGRAQFAAELRAIRDRQRRMSERLLDDLLSEQTADHNSGETAMETDEAPLDV